MVLGLVGATVFTADSLLKAISMVVMGLLLGLVGTDVNSGLIRFSFGLPELADGIGFIVVAMSFFGITEILQNLEGSQDNKLINDKISSLWPTRSDARRAVPAAVRGTLLGAVLGVLPGGGAAIASFAAYAFEKKVSRHAAELGNGAIEGVASPEAANNAAAQTSFVPMLTLGLPSNAVMALMIGAMMIHNIQPGPQVMATNPTLFWGLIASMWIGNAMLIVLNLPMVGLWVKLLTIPYRILFPSILVFCLIGVYSINTSIVDIYLSAGFAVLGLILVKLKFPLMPLILGFVLGPLMEEHFRRTLVLSHGDLSILVSRPLSLTLLLLAFVLLLAVLVPALRSKRQEAFQSET
jgi:putative tricarboxylic transport membrane protein